MDLFVITYGVKNLVIHVRFPDPRLGLFPPVCSIQVIMNILQARYLKVAEIKLDLRNFNNTMRFWGDNSKLKRILKYYEKTNSK